ncbi:hypothetical protein [Ruegeria sp.]|uniref:hypothetical protein n=1 Tax=Ruegeria sp. TaxID=1879320 RepID=UPI003B00AA0B
MFSLTALPDGFHENPYPAYAALREDTPVCPQSDGSVILSRYEDLDLVYRDTARFISDKKAVFGPKYGVESPLYEHHTTSLVFNDPPPAHPRPEGDGWGDEPACLGADGARFDPACR